MRERNILIGTAGRHGNVLEDPPAAVLHEGARGHACGRIRGRARGERRHADAGHLPPRGSPCKSKLFIDGTWCDARRGGTARRHQSCERAGISSGRGRHGRGHRPCRRGRQSSDEGPMGPHDRQGARRLSSCHRQGDRGAQAGSSPRSRCATTASRSPRRSRDIGDSAYCFETLCPLRRGARRPPGPDRSPCPTRASRPASATCPQVSRVSSCLGTTRC